jgi:hypothetical protein
MRVIRPPPMNPMLLLLINTSFTLHASRFTFHASLLNNNLRLHHNLRLHRICH